TPIHRAGYCAFYGECGTNPEVNVSLVPSKVPCVSNTPARVASPLLLAQLRSVCPELVPDDEAAANNTRVCCSLAQLSALQLSVALSSAVLTRCPACARNFANIYCRNVCSPDQSLFTNITRAVPYTAGGSNESAVLEYQCFYEHDLAEAAFTSCRDVRLPVTGGYAIDAMCGSYGARFCTAQRWLDFQGDKNNGLAPLQIDFHLVPNGTQLGDGLQPLGGQVWHCEHPLDADTEACSCQDCTAACPAVSAPPGPQPPFRLGVLDGTLVLCILLFAFLALLFLTTLTAHHCCARRPPAVPPPPRRAGVPITERMGQAARNLFARWGALVARHPVAVLVVAAVVVGVLATGMSMQHLVTDPVELWSAPESQARQEKAFQDEHFGPFMRTNQVIVRAPGRPSATYDSVVLGTKNFSGLLEPQVLQALLALQERLSAVTVTVAGREVTLSDVCYAPLNPANASLGDCCVISVTQYFQNNRTRLAMKATQTVGKQTGTVDWRDHLIYCVNSPLSFKDITALELSCMAEYGGPIFPYLAFGGYTDSEYTEAEALIVTYSLNNFLRDDPRYEWVLAWEQQFLDIVRDFKRIHSTNLSVDYMSEVGGRGGGQGAGGCPAGAHTAPCPQRSLEDEINRTTSEDLPIFTVSYLIVFAYVALALGEYTAWRRVLVESKVLLALGGIAVVLGAVFASMGFLAFMGLPSSLIILEVVPFLVLAVGADNIFIFVQEYQQQSVREPGETRDQHIGRVLAQVAPSMLLCSFSEVICFFLGALSSMPAVRTFAFTAALAIAFDFLLQISGFVALLALDARREEAARYDMCCCWGLEKGEPRGTGRGLLRPLMQRYYAPLLLHRILLFLFLSCAGIYFILQVPVGLDQELALPKDSYLLEYFTALNKYLAVGVPTYFITTGGYDFSSANGTNAICSSAGCDADSLTQKIQYATQFANVSYLAIPATSWVDDFLDWLNPTGRCCRVHQFGPNKGEFCPATSDALSCLLGNCLPSARRPTQDEFQRFLPWFLQDAPTLQCPKGYVAAAGAPIGGAHWGCPIASACCGCPVVGAPVAGALLQVPIVGALLQVPVGGAPLRVPHRGCQVAGACPGQGGRPGAGASWVVPLAGRVTYVYYEQYLTVVYEGLFTIFVCLAPTFCVSFVLLGMDLRSSCATLITIVMVLVDTVGAMALWDIPYNAVALINLVAAVGISVEFVSHITCAFSRSSAPGRVQRAADATVTMGSKVVAGVAMTNLPGVVVLAFAKAQLIHIFFFRLNLIITLAGLAHGLIFLPVLLSYIG
ncbi:NPCL1 protein, partial [Nothocercus julius]|nr:NPCL1 protein [Nothocercus julius]